LAFAGTTSTILIFKEPKSILKILFSPNKKMIIDKLYQSFQNFLSPKYCLICLNDDNLYLCEKCLRQLNFRINFSCFECGIKIFEKCNIAHHSKLIKFLISFGEYENENLKKLIILGKNEAKEILRDLANFIAKEILRDLVFLKEKGYFLTPVPLTKTKLLKRGFNQAEVLAERISELTGLKIFKGLNKTRETKDQAELNFEERLVNLKSAFSLERKPPKNIILIDDVKTTGTTLRECAKTLKENGAKNIIALTILK
jgi:competence protein ComFC